MKKFLLILALFIIISADDDVDPCTSGYELLKENTCHSLQHTGLSAQCSYSNNIVKKGIQNVINMLHQAQKLLNQKYVPRFCPQMEIIFAK